MAVKPMMQKLAMRGGCVGCNKICTYKGGSAQEGTPASKEGRDFGCNSQKERT